MAELTAIHTIHRVDPKTKKVVVIAPGTPLQAVEDELAYLLEAGAARLRKAARDDERRAPAPDSDAPGKKASANKGSDASGKKASTDKGSDASGKPDDESLVG